jgi:hypothetical protein
MENHMSFIKTSRPASFGHYVYSATGHTPVAENDLYTTVTKKFMWEQLSEIDGCHISQRSEHFGDCSSGFDGVNLPALTLRNCTSIRTPKVSEKQNVCDCRKWSLKLFGKLIVAQVVLSVVIYSVYIIASWGPRVPMRLMIVSINIIYPLSGFLHCIRRMFGGGGPTPEKWT